MNLRGHREKMRERCSAGVEMEREREREREQAIFRDAAKWPGKERSYCAGLSFQLLGRLGQVQRLPGLQSKLQGGFINLARLPQNKPKSKRGLRGWGRGKRHLSS